MLPFWGICHFKPEVVVMVKLDKPKTTQWAGSSSLPTFTKIADYLINYLNIPPDRKKFKWLNIKPCFWQGFLFE